MKKADQLEMFSKAQSKSTSKFELIRALVEQKKSSKEICSKLNISPGNLSYHLKKIPDELKIHYRGYKHLDEQLVNSIICDYATMPVREIAQKHKLGSAWVANILRERNLLLPHKGGLRKIYNSCKPIKLDIVQRIECLEMQIEILIDEIKKIKGKK